MKLVGSVQLNRTGRPEDVYCCYRPKADQLLHEVLVTGELIRFPFAEVARGKNVDQVLRPDFTLCLDDFSIHGELDRATEGYRQARDRMHVYTERREFVLWVAPTVARMEGLRKRAACIRSHALFKVVGESTLLDFHGDTLPVESLSDFLPRAGT